MKVKARVQLSNLLDEIMPGIQNIIPISSRYLENTLFFDFVEKYQSYANETVEAVKAIAEYEGPCYLRLNRNDYNNVTVEGKKFEIGVPNVLKEGNQVAVFATGYMTGIALEAAYELEGTISAKVINVSTLKPFNEKLIIEMAESCRGIVTAEEHSIIGGLGGAVSQALCKACKPIEFVGINDTFGCSAHSYKDVLAYHGLTKEHVIDAIKKMVAI